MARQVRRSDRVRAVAYLPPDLARAVDAVATSRGVSRSEMVVSILEAARRKAVPEAAPEPPPTRASQRSPAPKPRPSRPSEPPKPRSTPSPPEVEETPPEPPPAPKYEFKSDLMRRTHGQS